MTTSPHEAGEAEPFVPASLRHLPDPPTFYLRYGTPREKSEVQSILRLEGRTTHTQEAHRAALIDGMKNLMTEDEFMEWEPRIKEFWDASEAYAKELTEARNALGANPTDDEIEALPKFEFEGKESVVEVMDGVSREWHRCRVLRNDEIRWREDHPVAMRSVIVTGVENLDVELIHERRGRARYLTFDCALAIAEKLYWFATDAKVESPMDAVAELDLQCQLNLYLGEERAKNSASPVPSDPTPDTSKTGTGETAGKSKVSARSRKTRATASATTSGT